MKRVGFVVAVALLSTGIARADFQVGLQAFNDKDFAKAVTTWSEDAKQGDLNSQYNLGLLFEKGVEGYPKDLSKAYGWYRLAASQNAEAAKKAIERIKPLMTAGQIESGNILAVEQFGKWFRQNIGRDEEAYQAAKVEQKKVRNAKIEIERKAAAARAKRQRNLIAERDADAKLADQLQKESRKAAVRAAQEKAEEAKRHAFIEKRRQEEETRMAALLEEKNRQEKLSSARSRLAELQAKQQGTPNQPVAAPVMKTEPAPIVKPAPAPEKKAAPTVVAAPVSTITQSKAPAPAPVPAAAPVVAAAPVAKPVVSAPQQPTAIIAAEEPIQKEPVKAAPEKVVTSKPVEVAQKKTEPVKEMPVTIKEAAPQVEPKKDVVAASEPVVAETKAATPKKPYKAVAAPSEAQLAAKPATEKKITLPVMTNGLDVAVLKEIVEKANSVPLDSADAKKEIETARVDIEALQWSLISAARGKGSAKRMTAILEEKMSVVQIAEANRRAAEWISKRQKRQ